jgi:endogenous inhibitor of DNA gyrase (YacG/DUF329 family)
MKCPICKKEVSPGAPFAPFCSDRCRLIDLANWSDGKYVISTPANAPEEDDRAENEPVDED